MRVGANRLALAALAASAALATLGCSGEAAKHAAPAARVENSKPESQLSTVTLTPEAEAHLAIETATIGAEAVALTRAVGGEAIAPPGRAAIVTAPASGTLTAPGRGTVIRRVTKGQTIFELMPITPADRDASAEAEHVAGEAAARLTEAEQRYERQKRLLADGAVSARTVEESKAARDVAAAADQAARARTSSLSRLRIGPRGEMAITAPFDGVVTAVRAVSGQSVNAGAPLFEVAEISTIWVRVPLYAGELSAVAAGKPAAVAVLGHEGAEDWVLAQPVTGPPTADPVAASADLYYELKNTGEAIRPGEKLAVRLPLGGTESALVIPRSAVIYDLDGGAWVYEAREPHVFARRRVETGGTSGSGVIVRRGLSEGMKVVTVGAAELYGTEFFVGK